MGTSATILQQVEHRTYPLPSGPWVMMQLWHDLLFCHWPMAPAVLRPLIPPQVELETFKGMAWIGIVPFRMTHVHPRGLPPVPALSAFPELNLRTYVSAQGKPGVYFFSLDAGNAVAVQLARTFFHLPYFYADMSCVRQGDTIYYHSHRISHRAAPANYIAAYRPIAPVRSALRGSLEYWFTERYCLYTVFRDRLYRADIHHKPWPLQIAELETTRQTLAQAHGIALPQAQPLLHYAELQEVLVWPLQRVL